MRPEASVPAGRTSGGASPARQNSNRVVEGKANRYYRPDGYDPDVPTNLSAEEFTRYLRDKYAHRRALALARAAEQGWDVRVETPEGGVMELMGLDDEGGPIYYITTNQNARISTGVTQIQDISPYNSGGSLNGSGMRVGVWDGGAVRTSHREFGGRAFLMDGSPDLSDHATHVAGTVGATGVSSAARGMAPGVRINSYDWTSDFAEMSAIGANSPVLGSRLAVSNHSYGLRAGWISYNGYPTYIGKFGSREDEIFGRYSDGATDVDQIIVNNPYYLPFYAAGNDRTDSAPSNGSTYQYINASGNLVLGTYNSSTGPRSDGWDNGGFDTIIGGRNSAKNIVTVGAASDGVSNGNRSPGQASISSFSGWGPTDDGRIKPDLVANGVGVYSSESGSNSAYDSHDGTSMASPNAAGTAILLQQLHAREFGGEIMRSSALKALLIHTADDIGRSGPDYVYGWGLIDVKFAADTILAHQAASGSFTMVDGELSNSNSSDTHVITWDGSSPIRATLVWTDPAHSEITGLDNSTRALVNDLDLRILKSSTTYSPFRLSRTNPSANATVGDNNVDNVEQVLVNSPSAGTYTVRVNHKGSLSGGRQRYSLVITGQSSSSSAPALTVTPTSLTQTVNQGNTAATQSFNVQNTGQGTLFYSVADNASWLSVGPSSGTSTGEVDALSVYYNSSGLAAGVYNGLITVTGQQAGSRTVSVTLTVAAPSLPLEQALDLTGVNLSDIGAAPWAGQMAVTNDGIDAGKSGTIAPQRGVRFLNVGGWPRDDFLRLENGLRRQLRLSPFRHRWRRAGQYQWQYRLGDQAVHHRSRQPHLELALHQRWQRRHRGRCGLRRPGQLPGNSTQH